MGGDYYERDVEVAPVNNVAGYSNAAQKLLSQNKSDIEFSYYFYMGNFYKKFKFSYASFIIERIERKY